MIHGATTLLMRTVHSIRLMNDAHHFVRNKGMLTRIRIWHDGCSGQQKSLLRTYTTPEGEETIAYNAPVSDAVNKADTETFIMFK